MNYNILEARIKYKNKQLQRITLLVEISKGDIRAITAINEPRGGYMFIMPNAALTDRLLQEVAGTGMQMPFSEADKVFPNWRTKYL